MNDNQKLMHLLKSITATQDGKDFIELLNTKYVNVQLFNKDPIIMSCNVGQSELVQELNILLKMQDDDFTQQDARPDSMFD